MPGQKIRIVLKAFDHRVLDISAQQIYRIFGNSGGHTVSILADRIVFERRRAERDQFSVSCNDATLPESLNPGRKVNTLMEPLCQITRFSIIPASLTSEYFGTFTL